MPLNDVAYYQVAEFVQNDLVTPRYLTVDGLSGSTPLSVAMIVTPYPIGDVVVTLSTDGTDFGELSVLEAPDDNKLYLSIKTSAMKTLPSQVYQFEAYSPIAEDDDRISLGVFRECIGQGNAP